MIVVSKFSRNISASVLGFAVNILAGLWLTPYLIRHLGFTAFGLTQIAKTMVAYLAVITLAVNAGTSRFMILALSNGNTALATCYFNSSFFACLALCGILFIPALWFSFSIERFLDISQELQPQAHLLFLFAAVAFIIGELRTPFEVASFYHNRFDLRWRNTNLQTIVQAITVVVLFQSFQPSLSSVGISILVGMISGAVGSVFIWRRLMTGIVINPADWDWNALRDLAGTGLWGVVNQLGTVLLIGTDVIIANTQLGGTVSGHFAALLQWSLLLRSFGGIVAQTFTPTIMRLYALQKTENLISYIADSIRFLGIILALPIGLTCGLSQPILQLWLGSGYDASQSTVLVVIVFHLCLNLSFIPLFSLNVATNHIRVPGMVQLLFGTLNVLLAWSFVHYEHWGVMGIAASGAIVLLLRNSVFTPIYSAHTMRCSPWRFLRETAPGIILMPLVAVSAYFLSLSLPSSGITRLVMTLIIVAAGYGAATWRTLSTLFQCLK